MIRKIEFLLSYLAMVFRLIFSSKKNRFILLNSPEHGNLGDHAISLSEIQFFKKYKLNYVELSGRFCRKFFNVIRKNIITNDIICITGGGFLGSLWKKEDLFVQEVIKSFPKNRIIIFPQTLYFENNDEYLNNFVKVYECHKNIVFLHREEQSLMCAERIFGKSENIKNILMPDMVLLYDWKAKKNHAVKDKKILFCFRSDKEAHMSIQTKKEIEEICLKSGYKVDNISTVTNYSIPFSSRKKELNKLLKKMRNASLVITDRLHGMLLSYVAGTPCIALDNVSGKVQNVWKAWLQETNFIKFSDEKNISADLIKQQLLHNCQRKASNAFDNYSKELYKLMMF